MATCGACQTEVPADSETCPNCGVSFSGVVEDNLGECGACSALVPLDSKTCPQCGVLFVHDDVVAVLSDWMTSTGLDVETLFGRLDTDGNGHIDTEELRTGLIALKIAALPPVEVDRLVAEIDQDNNGEIELGELQFILSSGSMQYAESVLNRVMKKHDISDADAFIQFARAFDENENRYLDQKELKKAAEAFVDKPEPEMVDEPEDVSEEESTDDPEEAEEDDSDEADVASGEEESASQDPEDPLAGTWMIAMEIPNADFTPEMELVVSRGDDGYSAKMNMMGNERNMGSISFDEASSQLKMTSTEGDRTFEINAKIDGNQASGTATSPFGEFTISGSRMGDSDDEDEEDDGDVGEEGQVGADEGADGEDPDGHLAADERGVVLVLRLVGEHPDEERDVAADRHQRQGQRQCQHQRPPRL